MAEPTSLAAEFVTADKLPRNLPPAVPVGTALIRPEAELAEAKAIWNSFLDLRGTILEDPACYDEIDGSREMNRTGAMRLAVPFGLSMTLGSVEEGRVQNADDNAFDYRYRVVVRVGKGSRWVDGIGSCRLSEIPGKLDASKREHFALTKAWTRASKRAIADILGGTEAE